MSSMTPSKRRCVESPFKVLVFGGGGFVGRATCRALFKDGCVPIVADLEQPEGTWEYYRVDVSSQDAVYSVIEEVRPDGVVNLAYHLADACESNLDRAFRVNVVGSQNVMESCSVLGVARLVYASSIAVYGSQSTFGNREVAETDQGTPVRLYGWHKILQDQIAAEYYRRGLSVVGLRMSTVYGPERRDGLSAAVNELIYPNSRLNEVCVPWGEEEEFSLIHVDDVAESIVAILKAEDLVWSVVNSGGETTTIGALIGSLRSLRPQLRIKTPRQPQTLAHCSRINWERLRLILGHERISLSDRQRIAVLNGG